MNQEGNVRSTNHGIERLPRKWSHWKALCALQLFPASLTCAFEMAVSHHPINPEKLLIPGTLLGPISRELRAWSALNQHLSESKTSMTMFTGVWRERAWVLEPDKTKFESHATYQQSGIMWQFIELLICKMSLSFYRIRWELNKIFKKRKTYVRFNT